MGIWERELRESEKRCHLQAVKLKALRADLNEALELLRRYTRSSHVTEDWHWQKAVRDLIDRHDAKARGPGPADLVGALQDRIHEERGPHRPAKSAKARGEEG
jgi:hypothetical protein